MISTFLILLSATLGALITYLVSVDFKKGPILASSLVSLIFGLLCVGLQSQFGADLAKNVSLVFFGGSFVGMSSPTIIGNKKNVLMGGFFFGVVFLLTKGVFIGYGGGLGFRASLSVLITLGVSILLKNLEKLKVGSRG
jgi:hypothetical protein